MKITELTTLIEQRAEKAENLDFCKGIKLIKIKETIASMLETIGSNGIFEQYTVHKISHIDEMLKIAEWLIPQKTQEMMTTAEWLMLTLAIYFHDLGMVVSKKEFNERDNSIKFKEFREEKSENTSIEYQDYIKDDNYLYQEFVRKYHASRIKSWLENKNETEFGFANEQSKIINEILSNLLPKFKSDLAMICESHHRDDIDNFNKYKICARYGNDDNSSVNLNYIAIILRCADLLHITNDRTPPIERILLDISNPISVLEWEKQRAVRALSPQKKRNSEGNIDDTIEKDTIDVTAYFFGADTAEAYFGLSSYLQYMRKELINCNKIAELAKRQEGAKYDFPWRDVDESNITTEGFEAKKLSFTIEQDNILKLLVGHTLYNDSSVVVRELTQNAIDAIKLQNYIDSNKPSKTKKNKITIKWNSEKRVLSFYDNGTGMTISDIENYLLKVGASKYRQKQFEKEYKDFNPISRFGIGLLTCFMVANDVDIETNTVDSENVNVLCLRNVNGKYLLKKKDKNEADPYIKEHGTIINLHIRSDVDMSNLEKNLRKWIIVSEIPIVLSIDGKETQIGNSTLKDALISCLKDANINVDNKNIKVEEKTIGNVTVACALQYNNYLSDWSFLSVPNYSIDKKVYLTGTCVEGIRVEFSTPGYRNNSVFSLANIKGSKYQTNVARTALEYDESYETLKSIYDCYRLFVEDQILNLEKQNYSKAWALQEGLYLMRPLIKSSYYNDESEPINEKLLLDALSDIKCIFVEKDGCRSLMSVKELNIIDKFDIFDYKMINVIESLFREIPTEITVSKMIETVTGNIELNKDNYLLTNFNEYNILHRQILSNKQISNITVDPTKRKIQLTYVKGKDLWSEYEVYSHRRAYEQKIKVYIPNNDISINGLTNEIGVKTIGGIYLTSESDLCKYIKKVINILNETDSEDSKVLLNIFFSYIFGEDFLEYAYEEKDFDLLVRRFNNNRTISYSEEYVSKLWSIIDASEFKKIVLVKRHLLFSLANWTRRYD